MVEQPCRVDPLPGDEFDTVGCRSHIVETGSEQVPALRLTETLAGASNLLGKLVDDPVRVFVHEIDLVRAEPGLLLEFSPSRLEWRLPDIDAALRKLPSIR